MRLILKDSRIRALARPTTAYRPVYICLPIAWRAGLGSWGLAGKRLALRTPPQASIVRTVRLLSPLPTARAPSDR